MAILHRKNSLFYKTEHGAYIGDLFMSLIHTCTFAKTNPFEYLTTLQAEVILVHGRSDTMIPYSESLALAQALPPEQVKLFVVDGLVHVDVRIKQQDISQLLGAMEALLAQREHRAN